MEKQASLKADWKKQGNEHTVNLAKWTVGWVLTTAFATFGPIYLWDSITWLSFTAILLNFGVGIGMILSNIRHLNSQDELMQRIQLQSMGLALGMGVVAGLSYSMLDTSNVISSDAEIPFLIMLIAVTYLAALLVNNRRYK